MQTVADGLHRFCQVTEVRADDGRWCRLGIEEQAEEWRVWELLGQAGVGHGEPRLLALCPGFLEARGVVQRALAGRLRSGYRRLEPPSPLADLSAWQPLIDALRQYRRQQAETAGLRPYHVFSDAQLAELVRRRPGTLAELAECPGFGPAKLARYGEGVLVTLQGFTQIRPSVVECR